ncbi:MAG: exodeoxyribonuclease V subunit gamma [Syntrophobacterales bacterium CG_4_8_14_3_um_filter_49_14]|nr:MAG: exodeoxyribonuclease V subunit gamma [Syntrophobacterales bacterium CG_4_9_14_3_um_filter_49_8]PJC76827.1 MAG: exodeoxyribonuclease V subunit gamma [Syntrophobacterales bacterium CG_4_8_14_3_um_filter_49_14]
MFLSKKGTPMTGLRLFISNRLEMLAEKLAKILSVPLASPFEKEIIVVQSSGMERWISLRLARHYGICANYRFPFPRTAVNEIFSAVIPEFKENPSFEPEIMRWKVMKLLPSCITRKGFENLKNYLEDDSTNLKLFQLAERIAAVFDQYLIFRPEMIMEWERGKVGKNDERWQAELWSGHDGAWPSIIRRDALCRVRRELARPKEVSHPAAHRESFLQKIQEPSTTLTNLPERISLFGISFLPYFHLEIFEEISRHIEVNLFLINPSREFWGYIRSDREIVRKLEKVKTGKGQEKLSPEELYLEKGNSLLASLGTMGRDFFAFISDFHAEEEDLFVEPGQENMLTSLQSDILNLRDRGQEGNNKTTVDPNDRSIQIHSCHSPMREVEALYDNLLAMFEEDQQLLPGDILVMAPDIETYAPFIQAVFDMPGEVPSVRGESRRIPFGIADRSARRESTIIDAFLKIIALFGSRFGASQVLSVLEISPVREKFGLSEEDLELIRHWVAEIRIRWGLDGENRRQMGLPDFSENTWKAGLNRLLLGYAMPGKNEHLFNGILPYDHLEGSETLLLGKFLEYTNRLFSHVTALGRSRTLNEWSQTLTGLLNSFFLTDETTEREIQALRRAIRNLGDQQALSGFDEVVEVEVIKSYLRNYVEREGFGFGFMTGGVTFCTMLPMRSIPFKIIYLLGMNNEDYPRRSKALGFDLMARYPRPGDRSRRNDDRYLFLEAILSARKRLVISYIGQSIDDNSLIPPSVLISELLDYIEQGFELPGEKGGGISDRLVTTHRLQAFNPEYFRGKDKLFSYSEENLRAARCCLEPRQETARFITTGLSEPPEEWKTVELVNLVNFFRNPAGFLLKRRLQMSLEEGYTTPTLIEERESFDVKGLERYTLEEMLVEKGLSGRDTRDLFSVVRASGQLPHGKVGEYRYYSLTPGVREFVDRIQRYLAGGGLRPLDINLDIAGFKLRGQIVSLSAEGLIHWRYAKLKAKDHLRMWIYHLALNGVAPREYPRRSFLLGQDEVWEYAPVEKYEEILEGLLHKYWIGLSNPLKFFPETSWAYARQVFKKGGEREEGIHSARKVWMGSDDKHGKPGECEDPSYRVCFGKANPLDAEFQQLAEEIFGTLFMHQEGRTSK